MKNLLKKLEKRIYFTAYIPEGLTVETLDAWGRDNKRLLSESNVSIKRFVTWEMAHHVVKTLFAANRFNQGPGYYRIQVRIAFLKGKAYYRTLKMEL
jgi:hypothetical protein